MTRLIKAFPILFILILLSTETSTLITSNLAGIVTNHEDHPMEGVRVTYKGEVTTTNESGFYQYKNVLVDSKHNTVSIIKDGYFEAARTFRSTKSKEIFHQTKLIEKQYQRNFSSSIGGTVLNQDGNAQAPTIEIKFPANSIVIQGTQDQYDGEVQVAMHYIDPTKADSDQVMPGDLSILLADDILGKASTYGMAYVELQSTSGELLQIKEGAVAELKILIPESLRTNAPDHVISSSFDEQLGLWKEEDTATLSGIYYVSTVTHFSCWSYNSSSPSIVLTARLVDQSGMPLAGMHIQITEQGEWAGGYGYTDQDGIFTGAVAKDAVLNIYANMPSLCQGVPNNILNDELGPFASDTDLGDISVELDITETITVNASFFNCEDNPVTNGIVYVARSYFKITDGTLNVTLPVCGQGNHLMWAHDLDTDKLSERFTLSLGVNNFEDSSLCEIEARYLEVNAPTLGINERTNLEIGAYSDMGNKTVTGIYITESGDFAEVKLNFIDPSTDGFNVLAYNLTAGSISIGSFPPVLTYTADNGDGEVIIEEVSSDGLSDYIAGYYKVNFTEISTGTVHEFKGKFKLQY